MPRFLIPSLCLITGLAGSLAAAEGATLRLPHVFSDHAVLQREKPVPVWGWAAPGASVTIGLAGQTRTATAGTDGRWQVAFEPLPLGAPVELTATSGTESVKVGDLLVGDVWVCSGQSNMQFGTNGAINGAQEVAAADLPKIRLLQVPLISSDKPLSDITNNWVVCSPQTVAGFTAVGFFFGRELNRTLDVPIGLIGTSWGGTPAESWTKREALAAVPELAHFTTAFDQAMANFPVIKAKQEAELAARKTTSASKDQDDSTWQQPALDTSTWKDMTLPQLWEKTGLTIDGVVWFRHTVEIPAAAAGKDLALSLGPIDDADVTWFDGKEVGKTAGWNIPRTYTIPAALATAGVHQIAIQVTDTGGGGGIYGAPTQLTLGTASLAGVWKYRVAKEIPEAPKPPMGPGNPWLPTSLRNGMITPLMPYAIRGAIWYQGESNAGRAWQYRTLFPTMIKDWRADWGQGDFPFYFVQLANFTQPKTEPGDSDWAELRDAQFNTLRTLPATGMASAIDIGEAADIHPRNKQEVGRRLAQWAIAAVPGKQVEPSGPLFTTATVEEGRIRVAFDHLGGGLVAKDGPLKRFSIAGEDKVFVWADAVIDGATVVVSSAKVSKPVAVRYAWENNPEGCNLVNQAGLPASPFRTDSWPQVTLNNK